MGPESSPNRRSSEALTESAVADLMDMFVERIFIHGTDIPKNPQVVTPHEIQFDFNTKAVQHILERTGQDDGSLVTEAYAVLEREGEETDRDSRERQGTAVAIFISKLLAASPATDPISQNTWYAFDADRSGRANASYAFEFIQGGRPIMETTVSTTMEERLLGAMYGSSDRQRPLFRDDELLLCSLADLIGR